MPLHHGALRQTILEVLEAAGESLRIPEIQLRVEQRLSRAVSNHSVVDSLSSAAKNPAIPIAKLSPGRYKLDS
jgi:hypothetical protein